MQKPKYVMNCRIMSSTDNTIIIIPARMAASRLPGKPLADIAGKPMIQHVWERAKAADIAPVYVATDHQEIADVIRAAGGEAAHRPRNRASWRRKQQQQHEYMEKQHQYIWKNSNGYMEKEK